MKMGLSLGRVVRTSPRGLKRSERCGACPEKQEGEFCWQRAQCRQRPGGRKELDKTKNETKGLEEMQDGSRHLAQDAGGKATRTEQMDQVGHKDLDLSRMEFGVDLYMLLYLV